MAYFFAVLYSGLIFVFACIGVAYVAFKLYQWYRNRYANNPPLNQNLEGIQREHLEREEEISQSAIQSNIHLHENAQEIFNRFKDQQHHLSISIKAFEQMLEHIIQTNNTADEASRTLHYTVIEPMRILLERIKSQFDQSSLLLSSLSNAVKQSQSIEESRYELVSVGRVPSETSLSLRNSQFKAEYIKSLEEKNRILENRLLVLIRTTKKSIETKKHQDGLTVLLQKEGSYEAGHGFRLFGNGVGAELPSMDNEEKQDTLSGFVDHTALT